MKNIVYDDLIFRLQAYGGISTLFREIQNRVPQERFNVVSTYGIAKLQRVFPIKVLAQKSIFHSTFYGVPDRFFDGPVVTTVHDFTDSIHGKGLRSQVASGLINRAIKRADAIICVSENTKMDLLQRHSDVAPESVAVIYNAANEKYKPDSSISKEKIILYVGSRARYKNFDLAVQVASRIPDHKLLVIGGGQLSNSEEDLLVRLLQQRYEVLPNVQDYELSKLYNRASFLLYPSSYEGFGIPLVEAMQSGCPIVAVQSGAVKEVCGEINCLAKKAEVEELLNLCEKLIGSRAHRDLLVEQGLARARMFSWSATVNQTIEVYRRLGY